MVHYIDKDALVAEIERRIADIIDECNKSNHPQFTLYGKINALENLLPFINTLEMKDVDLNKEIGRVWDNTSDNFSEDGWKEFEDIAKHFFELGFKAQQ